MKLLKAPFNALRALRGNLPADMREHGVYHDIEKPCHELAAPAYRG